MTTPLDLSALARELVVKLVGHPSAFRCEMIETALTQSHAAGEALALEEAAKLRDLLAVLISVYGNRQDSEVISIGHWTSDELLPRFYADVRLTVGEIRALSATPPVAERGEWRPIESAPRDGRRLLLAGFQRGIPWVAIGHWAPYAGCVWNSDDMKPLQGVVGYQELPAPPSPRTSEGQLVMEQDSQQNTGDPASPSRDCPSG